MNSMITIGIYLFVGSILGNVVYCWFLFDYFYQKRFHFIDKYSIAEKRITFDQLCSFITDMENHPYLVVSSGIGFIYELLPEELMKSITYTLSFKDWMKARFSKEIMSAIRQLYKK